ncbi:hypothetical protein ACFLV0_07620, partial [Chloroflexota bacterium]
AILSLILRSLSKGGLATALFLALFFSYGRFYELLEIWDVFVPAHAHLLPAVLLAFGCCVYFIDRVKSPVATTTSVLNIMAVALIAINLFNIGFYQFREAVSVPTQPAGSQQVTTARISPEAFKTTPDIYLIILDEYAHPDTMKEWYDYDNSKFIKSLEDKGFFVAYNSKTSTGLTQRSIASLLNMGYVDETEDSGLFRKNADNKVVNFLKAKGYFYVCYGTHYVFGGEKVDADLYYDFWNRIGGRTPQYEFVRFLCNSTMVRPFRNHFNEIMGETFYRSITINTLAHLEKKIVGVPGPKFVFAYILPPHEPFVFGPNGERIASVNWSNYKDKQFYLGQYMFVSDAIQRVVDAILQNSVNAPIIIIQSDHGLRSGHPGIEVREDEWHKILNAYYLPSGDKELLYDSISPVNSFRLIFNHYLGADYDLLEDD